VIRHVREGFLKGIHVYIIITNHSSGSKCNAGTGDKHTVDSSQFDEKGPSCKGARIIGHTGAFFDLVVALAVLVRAGQLKPRKSRTGPSLGYFLAQIMYCPMHKIALDSRL
jgi:hypothetical protein